jgi:putative transposase
VKYALIKQEESHHAVCTLCRVLGASRSGYLAWRDRPLSARTQEDAKLIIDIRRVHLDHRQAYGYKRTWLALQAKGIVAGKHRVARLRRLHGIETKRTVHQRRRKEHYKISAVAADKLQQNFAAPQPNHTWAGDMTFIRTREGWLYLAVLLDLYSRKVVGYATDSSPGQVVHTGALEMALRKRHPPDGLIHHTDRGVQYRSAAYLALMEKHGIVPSMNGRKMPQDNAVAESFFSTLKNELIHHLDLRTRAEATMLIVDYIEYFYNRKRIHETLGYRTPEAFEQQQCGA